MIVRKIGNVTVYDDFKFSDSMNRVENLRIDLKQTFINQLIFAAMYIGISFFIMIFTVGYVHEITYLIIVLIALGIAKLMCVCFEKESWSNIITKCSLVLSTLFICFFAAARQPYVTALMFLLFVAKIFVWIKQTQTK